MYILIFLVSIFLGLNADQPIHLQLDEPIRDSLLANKSQFFQVKLGKNNKTSDWNLFFVVEPTTNFFWEKTEIQIFTLNQKKEETFSIDCIETGIDACFINANDILANETIYARVTCFEACQYQINTYWSLTYPINPDKNLLLDFQDVAYAKIFTLNLTNRDFIQFRLILRAQAFLKETAPIKLYANYGKKAPTLNSSDLQGIHLWDDGQGIFLRKDQMKQLYLTILIEGPAENRLRLEPHLISQYENKLKFQKPIFDYLNKSHNRTYSINLTTVSNNSEDLYLKLSTFSGSVQIDLYSDKELKNRILLNVFGNMGEIQFRISKFHRTALNLTDSLYAMVRSGDSQSTYLISTFMKINNTVKLMPDVTTYSQILNSELQSYYIQILRKQRDIQQIEQMINFHHIAGDQQLIPHFSICEQITLCAPTLKSYIAKPEKYDTIKPIHISKSGQTTHYRIKFNIDHFKQIDQTKVIKSILLITVYKSNDKNASKSPTKYSLTFVESGKIKNLKENKPERDRLTIGQIKYYKFININKDIKQIRIHLNEIAGVTVFQAFRKDPRNQDQVKQIPIVPDGNRLDIYENLLAPVYITVYGKENSFFSLTVQLIRDATITPNIYEKDKFNSLILARDEEYKFSLGSQEFEIVQIPPVTDSNFYEILLQYTDKPQICASYGKYPQHPNCEFMIQSKSYKITNVVTTLYLGIGNPNPKNIIVKIKYTELYGCEQKKMGEIWKKQLELPINYCINYPIINHKDIQIIISLSNQKYSSLKATFKINDKEYFATSAYININSQAIENTCNTTGPCNLYLSLFNNEKTTVQVVSQYIDGEISLLDGISQPVHGSFSPGIYKHFKLQLPNYQNVTIAIQSQLGSYGFYLKIFDTLNYKLDWIDKYPTQSDFHYKSSNSFYVQYSFFILNDQMIKKYCKTLPCILLISVSTTSSVVQYGSYIIQATQQTRFLKQHTPAIGYLESKSMAFYTYYYSQENGTLLISLTTENKQCANFYLSKGDSKRASNINHLKKNTGNEIIYTATKGMYSITVQAYQNCMYTISASSKNFKLYEILNGQYKDINLEANQSAYFFYFHYYNESFKLLSLEEYGEVLISGNATDMEIIETINNESQLQSSKFTWPLNKNFLKVSKSDKSFQPYTFYVFYLKALKKTSTSLILNIQGTEVPLSNKKRLTDNLNILDQIKYTIYTYQKFLNLTIFVHYGEIQVTVYENESVNISKKFKKSNASQVWQVDLQANIIFAYKTKLSIKAIQTSLYQLEVITNKQQKTAQRVKSGLPTYLFLTKNTPKCVRGSIQSKDHKFVISVGKKSKQELKKLRITGKIAKKIINKFEKQIIDNTMSLSFDLSSYYFYGSEQYTLCFQTSQYLSLTILPVASISLIPEATSMVVHDSKNFTFSSEGKLILEVYECIDDTKILLSSDFNKIGGSESQLLHWRKLGQNYLVQFESYGLVYLNVQGTKSLIRWKHVQQQKGEGIGYYLFKIPSYKHTYNNKQLKITIEPLNQMATNPKVKIVGINYTVFLSDSEKNLKQTSQCNIGRSLHSTFLQFNPQMNAVKNHLFIFEYENLNKFFGDNKTLYITVVAQVEIQIILTRAIEDYKFIYEKEEINWETLKLLDQKPEKPNQRLWKLMEFLVIGGVISIFTICCIREIIKVTLKYRNKSLIQTQAATQPDQPHSEFKQEEET